MRVYFCEPQKRKQRYTCDMPGRMAGAAGRCDMSGRIVGAALGAVICREGGCCSRCCNMSGRMAGAALGAVICREGWRENGPS